MEGQDWSLDKISNLPSIILENILCLVPIKDAARTSILSRDWRYHWTKIPKLVFDEKDMSDKTTDVFFAAIHQVLKLHQGPILEFSLLMIRNTDDNSDELDQIIIHLARNSNTVKKFTLTLTGSDTDPQMLPLSISLLHQLTDLYIYGFIFHRHSIYRGFGNLASLFVQGEIYSKHSLLGLLSNCPLLKRFELEPGFNDVDDEFSLMELFKCLSVIEHLTINIWNIQRKFGRVRRELPTAFVHLKYFCLKSIMIVDNSGLGPVDFVIRNSPNLESIKLELIDVPFKYDDTKLVTLEDCSDIWLEHLKEFEIVRLADRKGDVEFVKLILAKSPVLMKVRIILNKAVTKDEELEIVRILLGSPRVSPLAEITVECQ